MPAVAAAAVQMGACPVSIWSRCVTLLYSMYFHLIVTPQCVLRICRRTACRVFAATQTHASLLQREKDYLLLADVPGVPKVRSLYGHNAATCICNIERFAAMNCVADMGPCFAALLLMCCCHLLQDKIKLDVSVHFEPDVYHSM